MINSTKLLSIAKSTVKVSLNEITNKKFLLNKYRLIDNKKELKTKLDQHISKLIIRKLSKTKISCISEESNLKNFDASKTYWIIDPIDGTTNLNRGLLGSSISLALYSKGKILFGVVGSYPELKIFWGGLEYGSFKNDKKITVSKQKQLSSSILASGFPTKYSFDNKNNVRIFKYFKKFSKIRMIGSASLSLAFLAEGKIDYYYERNIRFWDIAAGLAILEGAGGKYKYKFLSKKILTCEVHANNGLIYIDE